jgi:hypothetical protein
MRTITRQIYERDRQEKRRETAKEYVDDLKRSTPCADCNRYYEPYQMDFDHILEDGWFKRRDVAVLVNQGRTLNVIKREIEKCQLVCTNCHRQRTYERGYR